MNMCYIIFASSMPLMLSSFGALLSDCALRLAIFIDGIINLSAFLCFAFTIRFASLAAGCLLAVILCIALIAFCLLLTEAFHADPFLIALSLNITASALVSYLSSIMFSTRGVLTNKAFTFDAQNARNATALAAFSILVIASILLMKTRGGLYLRLCGDCGNVEEARGITSRRYIALDWIYSGLFAAITGCILAIRLSSFVPNVSSGMGYLSCAIVYMARSISRPMSKSKGGTGYTLLFSLFAIVLLLSAINIIASRVQNVYKNVMPYFLLAMPYLASLVLLAVIGQSRYNHGN